MDDLELLLSKLFLSPNDLEKIFDGLLSSISLDADRSENGMSQVLTSLNLLQKTLELYLHSTEEKHIKSCEIYMTRIVKEVVMPLLRKEILLDGHTETEKVCLDLLMTCLPRADNSTQLEVWQHILVSLSSSGLSNEVSENTEYKLLNIDLVLTFLKKFLKMSTTDSNCQKSEFFASGFDEKVYLAFINLLTDTSDKSLTVKISTVMLSLLRVQWEAIVERLKVLWEVILKIYDTSSTMPVSGVGNTSNISENPYIILTAMADLYFPIASLRETLHHQSVFDLKKKPTMWRIIQEGLVQQNPMTRKRALYLLKRIVDICSEEDVDVVMDTEESQEVPIFSWSSKDRSSLSKLWENFFLLIETLNEKQIHVVQPVFPRLDKLIEACARTDSKGKCLFHLSWVITIVRRAILHESSYVLLWAVKTLLKMKPSILISHGEEKYISGEFLKALMETKLYSRDPDQSPGTPPEIGPLLSQFFHSVWSEFIPIKRAIFFRDILLTIRGGNWSCLPLLYLSQALAHLPAGALWDLEAIRSIREIISTSIGTMEPFVRATVQCFLVESLIKHIDMQEVPPAELAVVLGTCNKQESLQRGTTLWKNISSYLSEYCKSENCPEVWKSSSVKLWLQTSITQTLKTEQHIGDNFSLQLSRFILLFADGLEKEEEITLIDSCLSPIKDILVRVISHAYLSCETADRALDILIAFLNEAKSDILTANDHVINLLMTVMNQSVEGILYQIVKGKDNIKNTNDLDRLHLYLQTLESLGKQPWLNSIGCYQLLEKVEVLVKWSVSSILKLTPTNGKNNELSEEMQMCLVASMSILCKIQRILAVILPSMPQSTWLQYSAVRHILEFLKSFKPLQTLERPTKGDSLVTHHSQKVWGKAVSLFLTSQWEFIHVAMTTYGEMFQPQEDMVEQCLDVIDLCSSHSTLPVINCLQCLLPKVYETNSELVLQSVERVWCRLIEVYRSPALYWEELHAFVEMSFQPVLMTSCLQSPLMSVLKKHLAELFKQAEERRGIVNVLINQFAAIFKQDNSVSAIPLFCETMAEFCIVGDVPRRIERSFQETFSYIHGLGDQCSVNQLMPYVASLDVQVRLSVINFLTSLHPDSQGHRQFITSLISNLIQTHHKLNSQPMWNFLNSQQHRQRHRLTQTLLTLEPFVLSQDLAVDIWTYAWSFLATETQPSVRNYLEWLIIRLTVKFHNHLLTLLWNMFQTSKLTDKCHKSLCSMMFVTSHLGPHLPAQLKEQYLRKALGAVFPWCTVHHFNTRIHAFVTLKKLWHQCELCDLRPLQEEFPLLRSCIEFNMEHSHSTKKFEKLEKHYIFAVFDIFTDFNAETIFMTLPYLSGLNDEECISPSILMKSDATWCQVNQHYLPLWSPNDKLKNCEQGSWRLKGEDKWSSQVSDEAPEEGDVQKKILPWRCMKPDADVEEEIDSKLKREDGLVLVTSLVEKIPNLGGLCRTSEIFGVSEFVVGSLQVLNDKAFQSLSVTAHKWISITEVKTFQIEEFLETKKSEGYTLVGVEQTANSVSLDQYHFPKKTLLLLGNEKEGIPVNLIQCLDVCVEIPQQGVIRSLNVHVTGALFVWEYRRQQLTTTT